MAGIRNRSGVVRSATIDGANSTQVFFGSSAALMPIVVYAIITAMIGLQMFDVPVATNRLGNPDALR